MLDSLIPLFSLYELFDNTFFYLTFIISMSAFLGMFSKSFIVGAFSGFLMFASLTLQTEYEFYQGLFLVVMAIVLIFMSFQIYNKTKANEGTV